ncbi:hypothetical protein PVL30_000491 [Lodderomyces elongisporus]|uniref:uncharacterized protein n=1 Tax=Lodderomyces elongisporus TaxID=36914 RepID=UPI00291CCA14|nr:uncharacterized protein PVL30_000491 [Lodderomyces elongisporus]WLF76787.1 hypothetical protein PVL30_000491 [Lodderomyces elongisporus]
MIATSIFKTKNHKAKNNLRNIVISNPLTTNEQFELAQNAQNALLSSTHIQETKPRAPAPATVAATLESRQIILMSEFEFQAESDVELSMQPKDFFKLLEKQGDGWLKVCELDNESKFGLVPASYMKIAMNDLENPITKQWLQDCENNDVAEGAAPQVECKTNTLDESITLTNSESGFHLPTECHVYATCHDSRTNKIWHCIKMTYNTKYIFVGKTYENLAAFASCISQHQHKHKYGKGEPLLPQLPQLPKLQPSHNTVLNHIHNYNHNHIHNNNHNNNQKQRVTSLDIAQLKSFDSNLEQYWQALLEMCHQSKHGQLRDEVANFIDQAKIKFETPYDNLATLVVLSRLSPTFRLIEATKDINRGEFSPRSPQRQMQTQLSNNISHLQPIHLNLNSTQISSDSSGKPLSLVEETIQHTQHSPVKNRVYKMSKVFAESAITDSANENNVATAAASSSGAFATNNSDTPNILKTTPTKSVNSFEDNSRVMGMVSSESSSTLTSYTSLIEGYDREDEGAKLPRRESYLIENKLSTPIVGGCMHCKTRVFSNSTSQHIGCECAPSSPTPSPRASPGSSTRRSTSRSYSRTKRLSSIQSDSESCFDGDVVNSLKVGNAAYNNTLGEEDDLHCSSEDGRLGSAGMRTPLTPMSMHNELFSVVDYDKSPFVQSMGALTTPTKDSNTSPKEYSKCPKTMSCSSIPLPSLPSPTTKNFTDVNSHLYSTSAYTTPPLPAIAATPTPESRAASVSLSSPQKNHKQCIDPIPPFTVKRGSNSSVFQTPNSQVLGAKQDTNGGENNCVFPAATATATATAATEDSENVGNKKDSLKHAVSHFKSMPELSVSDSVLSLQQKSCGEFVKLKIFLHNQTNDIIVMKVNKCKLDSLDYLKRELSYKIYKDYTLGSRYSFTVLHGDNEANASVANMCNNQEDFLDDDALLKYIKSQRKCSLKLMRRYSRGVSQ